MNYNKLYYFYTITKTKNLFEAADKRTMDRNKLKLYDNMIRDEIQIKAEKDFAVRKAMQEGIEKGIKRGIEQGIQKGSHDANLSSARNLLSAGVDIETISRCTGLSIEEINGAGRQ